MVIRHSVLRVLTTLNVPTLASALRQETLALHQLEALHFSH